MPNVIATHAVGNMETWLAGSENRSRLFKEFCTSYRIYRHVDQNKVSIFWENADLAKLEETLGSSKATAAKAADTVLEPVELFVEIEGGR